MIDSRKPTPEKVHQIGVAVFTAMATAAVAALVNALAQEIQRRLDARRPKDAK